MIDISAAQLETVKRILVHHVPGCEIRVFGSRIDGTARKYSDLDLAIIGEEKLPWDRMRLMKEAFEESDLPFRVDLLAWHAIPEKFRAVISKKYEILPMGDEKPAPDH